MIKAKKKYGQNFLKDSLVLNKIIQAIPNDVNSILEIGAGLGDLTRQILKIHPLISYEIDSDLFKILNKEFKKDIEDGRLTLVLSDANDIFEKNSSYLDKKYFLVANLPYYVATKIILNAYKDKNCQGFIVMIQKEVALKFSAKAKDSNFNSLSILGNLQGQSEILFDVDATCFEPVPKVTSSVMKFVKEKELIGQNAFFEDEKDYDDFCNFLKLAFFSPRKTLLKNLSSHYNKSLLIDIFKDCKLEDKLRPHQLNITLYLQIYKKVKNERRTK